MRMMLKREWAVRIFEKLSGIYGSRTVANKFSQIIDGVDRGTDLTIQELQKELGVFNDRPDALAWALENLPADKIPNVLEIKALCNAAPRSMVAIEYKAEPADPVKVAEIAQRASKALSDTRDYLAWAKHPAGAIAFESVKKLADSGDFAFKVIMNKHIEDGICTEDGKLLKAWKGQQWVAA